MARRKLVDTRGRPPAFNETQKAWISDYLKRPDISYTCPGRKDQVYIGKDTDGNKLYHCKHYLLWFLREIHPMLNETIQQELDDDEQFTVSYGSLWCLIQELPYIKYRSDVPENSCTCEYCENLELFLEALSRKIPQIPTGGAEIMNLIVCDPNRVACVDLECETCGDKNEFAAEMYADVVSLDEVTYYKWVPGEKFPLKQQFVVTGKEAAAELKQQLNVYRRHQFNNCRQHKELKVMKQGLPGSKYAIIQVDYAENYVNTQKNAIQSAYFGQESFSLYTVCMWYYTEGEVKSDSFCLVSDCMEHSKISAYHFNSLLVDICQQKVPDLEAIHFWSDGCASQFKSKFCFALMVDLAPRLYLTWNYFESHHGKGPVDGIGGKVKSSVYTDVKAGVVVISSAKQFADYANVRLPGITTLFISKEEITDTLPEYVPDVPGTLKVRSVSRETTADHVELKFYRNSQFAQQDEPFCIQKYKETLVRQQQLAVDESESAVDTDASQDANVTDLANVKVNDFAAVVYDNQWWLGTVQEVSVENQDILISFLHPCGPRTVFHWPRNPDICWVKYANLLSIMDPENAPTVQEQGIYA